MNDLFSRFFGQAGDLWGDESPLRQSDFVPATNVSETEDALVITQELPGVDPKDVEIGLQDNVLTIKGQKREEKDEKSENWHRVERSYGSFQRSFRLASGVNADKVSADYKNGVLRVTLPKAPEAKRKQIPVKVV